MVLALLEPAPVKGADRGNGRGTDYHLCTVKIKVTRMTFCTGETRKQRKIDGVWEEKKGHLENGGLNVPDMKTWGWRFAKKKYPLRLKKCIDTSKLRKI